MDKKKISTALLTVSVVGTLVLFFLVQILSILDIVPDLVCYLVILGFFLFAVFFVCGLIVLYLDRKKRGERLDFNVNRKRCPKCNRWIDIRNAVRPCVVKCKKCKTPLLLDLEEEDVKVKCPSCLTEQVQHVQCRPAEVPCQQCGVSLLIPRKY